MKEKLSMPVASAFYLRGKNNLREFHRVMDAVASAFYLRGKNNIFVLVAW